MQKTLPHFLWGPSLGSPEGARKRQSSAARKKWESMRPVTKWNNFFASALYRSRSPTTGYMNFSCQTALFDLVVYLRDPSADGPLFSRCDKGGRPVRSGSAWRIWDSRAFWRAFHDPTLSKWERERGCTSAEVIWNLVCQLGEKFQVVNKQSDLQPHWY